MRFLQMIRFNPFYLFSVVCFASFIRTELLSLPGCLGKCGNLTIPFPFGLTSDCCFDDTFHIICDTSFEPPKPFLRLLNAQVVSISLDGKLEILNSSLAGLEGREADQILPLVVEWAAGNVACRVAQRYGSRYACQSQHSQCMDSSVEGHICRCLPGYEGNPYIADGCQDIDDCAVSNPCEGVCVNLPGSFKCYCPKGLVGDGRKDGIGCHTQHRINLSASVLFLIALTVIATILAINFGHNIPTIEYLKEEDRISNLEMNGGYLLEKKLPSSDSKLEVYDTPALDLIAHNFSDKIVTFTCKPVEKLYHGTLPNGVRVIVMIIKPLPESVLERFVEQLIFLSKPHTNLVRVLGCCLDKPDPVIVYERHGDTETTLYDLITRSGNANTGFSREMRLKAAAGVANGLEHFNYHKWWPRSTRLVHGNICSANIIMMDDSSHPKIFYAAGSNLITRDASSSQDVYRDPKFPHKRSDVYSFGVVLVELLIKEGCTMESSIEKAQDNRLLENVDEEMIGEGEVVRGVATLANECLNANPDERPNMKEVSKRLSLLTKSL